MPASHAEASASIPGSGRARAPNPFRVPRLLLVAVVAFASSLSTGCGESSRDVSEAGAKGVVGSWFVVSVSRPQYGTVTSGDGQINCGPTASACSATYAWSATVALTATPAPGYGLRTWAGDCSAIGTCVLDTKTSGADKFVVAVFDLLSNLGHPNWSSPPALHARAFYDFVGGVAGALQCTSCHGATYGGLGIAPSCNACHSSNGWTAWKTNCSFCHGAKTPASQAGYAVAAHPTWAAPPDDVAGRLTGTNSASRTGAHAAHLTGTTAAGASFSAPLLCATCHQVPTDVSHIRGSTARATVVLAASGQASLPASLGTYAPSTGTCSTYCHGSAPSPAWASTGLQCGDCHGLPPATSTGHPQVSSALTGCASCHPATMNADGTLNLAGGQHLDGIVEVAGGGHPYGWSDPSQHGLAALAGGLDACTTCHTGFGPVNNGSARTSCDICHADPSAYGPFASGAYPPHPSWQTECTFCHGGRGAATGAPPRNTHVISSDTTTPQATTDATIGAHTSHVGTASSSPASLHGIATGLDCNACHQTRWASALDAGHVDKATADVFFNAVGSTANAGSYARPSCSTTYCHGDFAGGAGAGAISWTGSFGGAFTLSCASCHGAPPATSATVHHPPNPNCGSCHAGYGPAAVNVATHVDGAVQHAPATGCTQCHGDLTVSGVANTDVRAAPGSDANATDAHGSTPTSTGARGVGTHARHLTGTRWRATAIACAECHAVPAAGDTSHATGTPALTFGTLARTAWTGQPAITPVWNGAGGATTLTCSSTYCHGAFKNGANAAPTWTAAGSVACGSCHGVSATNGPGGSHPTFGSGQSCGSCHGGTYTNASVDPALHMNGALDVANLTCSSCHGDSTRLPVASATGLDALGANLVKASPPADAGHGAAATGAHLAHLNQDDAAAPGPLSNAFACSTCHPVPTSTAHSNGTVGVAFGGLATTGGVSPAPYDFTGHGCASTYCHGNFTGGAGANAIAWTASGKLACTGCHGAPPGPTSATVHHPPNPSCTSCHSGYTATTVAAATHVDGTVQHTPATGCTQCHGDLTVSAVGNADVRSAPGTDANAVDAHGNSAATARGVGVHGKHLTGSAWRASPIGCGECHTVPAAGDTSHVTGSPTISFGALARTAWAGQPPITPAWNGAGGATTLTCSSTYCHGAFKNGANAAPTWTAAGTVACGSCHGVSATSGPGGTHPTFGTGQNCGTCHGGTYTNASVDASLHMNGALDVSASHPPGWSDPSQHGLAAVGGLDACSTCHTGFGPANGSAGTSCDICHADPAAYGPYASGAYPPHPSWKTECSFCHGGRDAQSGAPPRNTHVISSDTTTPQATTDATIGAHTSHVGTASSAPASRHALATGLDCTACHQTRWTSALDPGHVDKTTADVFFNAVGSTADPGSYARPSCASTYCHGNFPGGAGSGAVAWTGSFGASLTLSCASCHGAPPATSATVHHPPNPNCGSCHSGYGPAAVNVATHVDGAVQHAPATGCTQCHGDLTVSAVASTDVRAAPGSDANAVDAHGNAAAATTARGVGVHGKHLTGTAWRASPIGCRECHSVPAAGDTSHATGTPGVTFGALARTAWTGQPAITPVWNGAGGATTLTCSSTYCHGAFKNGANAAPTWTAAGSVACGSCHGVSATNGPGGTHPTFGTGQSCGSCHGGSYTNASVDPALHMNGALDVANLTCSSCHGDASRNPVASAGALDALGAYLVKASPPVDAGHGAAATGAHLAHANQDDAAAPGPLSNAFTCSTCHPVPTSTAHSNGTVAVTFGGLATTGGVSPAPYDFTGHGCASTYCHGNFTGGAGANAVAWTTTGKLACTGCHGAPPGPTSATVHHPPNPTCVSCHAGYTATTVAAATHVDGTIQHTPTTGCTQCHGDLTVSGVANTDIRVAPATDANAVDAHGNSAATARGVGAHGKHLTSTTWRASPIACGECHAVPAAGDTSHVTGSPTVTFGTLAKTAWAGQPGITPVWNGAGGGTTLTCSSTYCHGAFPNGANDVPTWNAAGSVGCGSCHAASAANGPGGTHPPLTAGQDCGTCHGGSYTNTSVDPALHMNGQVDGGGESGGGASCAGCHGAIFSAMNGTVTHATKHALATDSPADSGITWANPLSNNAAASRSCVNMCHGDHPHDLSSPATATHENNAYLDATTGATRAEGTANRVGVGGTGGTPNRMKADYDGTLANGGLCASCHRNPVNAGHPAVDKAAFDASAHDYTTNTVSAVTYSWAYGLHDGGLFVRDCTKCHASSAEGTTPAVAASGSATVAVHFSDNASLLAGTSRPAGTAAGFVCYNCHGSAATPAAGAQGNRSGKDIQSQIAHATTSGQSGHPANSDTVHDSVAENTTATFGNELGVAAGAGQRHASCMDCHDSHRAKAGTHAVRTNLAGPPLEGAWGAQLSTPPAFWTDPTSAAFTKSTMVAGTDAEATLCFKCHSSFYGTLPTSPSGGYTETDTAKEFNPNNAGSWFTTGTTTTWSSGETAGGFHPVLATAGNNLGAVNLANLVTTNIAWSTTARNLMTCSDCHESDATTDPNGPHGSAAGFILRGPNTLWNGTMVATSSGMPAGAFCANCHSSTYANSRYIPSNGHTARSAHRVNCWNCHARIPHGGPRPGMLVAPAGAVAGVGGTIAGWDNAAPYFGLTSASTRKLYLKSYPSSPTAQWQQSNCGCNGTGH